jgi:hypothetical protein
MEITIKKLAKSAIAVIIQNRTYLVSFQTIIMKVVGNEVVAVYDGYDKGRGTVNHINLFIEQYGVDFTIKGEELFPLKNDRRKELLDILYQETKQMGESIEIVKPLFTQIAVNAVAISFNDTTVLFSYENPIMKVVDHEIVKVYEGFDRSVVITKHIFAFIEELEKDATINGEKFLDLSNYMRKQAMEVLYQKGK